MSSSSSLSLSHNERIAAKRERTCLEFMETTSTNISTAKHYMKQTAYNLERAVSLFYDNDGEGLPSDNDDDDDENNNSNNNNKLTMGDRIVRNNTDRNTEVDDPISAIMDAIKKEKPQEPSSLSSSFVGKGFSLNDSGSSSNSNSNSTNQNNNDEPSSSSSSSSLSSSTNTLEIIVVFYKDGFTAQEDEKQDDTTKSTVRRRRGVHSFSSSESSSSLRRILLLPPLRKYEENQQFIQDVKEKRVPVEFRRFDNSRRPVPVSISLDDRRSTNYPFDEWEKQEKEKSCSFGGTGNTLGGGYSSSSSSSTRISNNHYVNNNNENGYVASILCLLISLWNLIVVTINKLWCITRTAIVPLQEHVVDPEKSTTTISIRIMSSSGNNKREQVVFNTDHTVDDVKRYCRIELLKKEAVDDTVVGEQEFELLAGFPPKVVDDVTQKSLEELGLLNSAIEIRILSTIDEKRRN